MGVAKPEWGSSDERLEADVSDGLIDRHDARCDAEFLGTYRAWSYVMKHLRQQETWS
jgi:hypothetical protein